MSEAFGLLIGILTMVLTFKPFFQNSKGFQRCIQYWLKPDLLSLMDGEYSQDASASAKLGAWLFLSGLAGFLAFTVATSIFK